MRRGIIAAATAGLLAVTAVAGCGSSNNSASPKSNATTTIAGAAAQPFVGVILPDTKSSARYETQDLPNLTAAFKAAGVKYTIQNAQGDTNQFQTIADSMLNQGVNVLIIDSLDSASGTAVINKARQAGVPVIDYDRLTVGGGADYYVSFNNVTVGKLQGRGLVNGLKAKGKFGSHPVVAQLNGGITDNNAKLFKQGYDSILNPLFNAGTFKKATAGDQWTDWDPIKGRTIFDQMLARNGNKIDAVLAANDGLAGAVIASEKAHGVGPVPLTGQDATPTGVQFILAGWQTGTVYKSVRAEAAAAARAAINILKHKPVKTNAKVSGTKSILLTPVWINKNNYKLLFREGFLKRSQVCVGSYAQYCH